MADRCLRRVAWNALVGAKSVSPSSALCALSRVRIVAIFAQPNVLPMPVRGMQSQMLPAQYTAFSQRLISYFSRNSYYERRRGDRLCSPADIAFIREALASIGLFHLEFDAYEDHYNFVD